MLLGPVHGHYVCCGRSQTTDTRARTCGVLCERKMWRGERAQTGSTGRESASARKQGARDSQTTPQVRPDASFSSLGNAGKRARASSTILDNIAMLSSGRTRGDHSRPLSRVPAWLVAIYTALGFGGSATLVSTTTLLPRLGQRANLILGVARRPRLS